VRENRLKSGFCQLADIHQAIEIKCFYKNSELAHNLNVAVQPAAMNARWFRSRWISAATRLFGPLFGKSLDFRAVRIRFPVEPRQWQQELRREI
jgi:hypothetical protein